MTTLDLTVFQTELSCKVGDLCRHPSCQDAKPDKTNRHYLSKKSNDQDLKKGIYKKNLAISVDCTVLLIHKSSLKFKQGHMSRGNIYVVLTLDTTRITKCRTHNYVF